MQVNGRKIAYEVTISQELRTFMRERRSVERVPVTARDRVSAPARATGRFSDLRLRVDGQRPLRVSASEILTLRAGEPDADAASDPSERGDGHASLRLFLTEEGTCFAHMVAEPGAGLPARPIHRLGQIQTPSDVLAIVSGCRADLGAYMAAPTRNSAPGQGTSATSLPAHQFTQLMQDLAPFVETPRN